MVINIIRYSGLFYFIKNYLVYNKITIVLYHNPKPEDFEKHIRFLDKHYSFISMDTVVEAIRQKDWSKIKKNSISITFDDGHAGNFQLLDIIKRYKINPTIYCCSDIIGTNRHFWWKETETKILQSLKNIPNKSRLAILKNKYNYLNVRQYNSRQSLSINEIQSLINHVSIGSHTRFHPILTCSNNSECEDEINTSKYHIENISNNTCNHFCYPNGDYNEEIVRIVKKAGYNSARTTDVGWNDINSDPFKLKITGITDDASINQLIAQLTGVTMYMRYLFAGSLRGKNKTNIPKEKQ